MTSVVPPGGKPMMIFAVSTPCARTVNGSAPPSRQSAAAPTNLRRVCIRPPPEIVALLRSSRELLEQPVKLAAILPGQARRVLAVELEQAALQAPGEPLALGGQVQAPGAPVARAAAALDQRAALEPVGHQHGA